MNNKGLWAVLIIVPMLWLASIAVLAGGAAVMAYSLARAPAVAPMPPAPADVLAPQPVVQPPVALPVRPGEE